MVRLAGDPPPPPCGQSDHKIPCFFMASLKSAFLTKIELTKNEIPFRRLGRHLFSCHSAESKVYPPLLKVRNVLITQSF